MERSALKLRSGVWATVGGVLGSSAAPLLLPTLAPAAIAELGIIGAGIGLAVDSSQSYVFGHIRRSIAGYWAIFDKLDQDFSDSPLSSWLQIEKDHGLVVDRLLAANLATSDDLRLAAVGNLGALRRYLGQSSCWDGWPRADSLRQIRSAGPIVVNSSSHNVAVQAALTVMAENFGIPLEIDGAYWHGAEQVAAINRGAYADFVIVVDPNVFLSPQDRMSKDFRFLLPCYWQKHKVVRRRRTRSYDNSRIWFASGTSGEEQSLLDQDIRSQSDPTSRVTTEPLDVVDLVGKVDELEPGDGVIAWEPLLTLHGISGTDFLVSDTSRYKLSASLYGHKTLLTRRNAELAKAFQDCFIAAWNFARMSSLELAIRVAFDSDCHPNFERMRSMTEDA